MEREIAVAMRTNTHVNVNAVTTVDSGEHTRPIDRASIRRNEIITEQRIDAQMKELPEPTFFRRLLKLLFPLVEENQRVRS